MLKTIIETIQLNYVFF